MNEKRRRINNVSQEELNSSVRKIFENNPIEYLLELTTHEADYKDAIYSFCGVIVENELALCDKTYETVEKISVYLDSIGKDKNVEYDPEKLIYAIDFIAINHPSAKEMLISFDDITTSLVKKVYFERYKEEEGIKVTGIINKNLQLAKTEYTKEILLNAKKFFHFKENMMPEVYKTRLNKPSTIRIK